MDQFRSGPRLMTLLYVVGAVVALLALVWILQRRLIYFPLTDRVPAIETVLPGGEEHSFATADGVTLGGWFLRAHGDTDPVTVLIFNGNAGDRSFRAPLARALANNGYSAFLFDYRGYGGNGGRPSEAGLLADALGARNYLAERPGVEPSRIVYYGESLGAAVAVGLALEKPPAALVLRSPFTSLTDVARFHYRFLPVRLLLRDRYPSLQRMTRLSCPVLVVAGDEDRIVPAAQSEALYQAAPGPKRYLLLKGAGHNDPEMLSGPRLLGTIASFLEEVLAEEVGQR